MVFRTNGDTTMRTCTVNELEERNYNVVFINALQQFWHTTKEYQCFGMPKRQNLFLLLDGCRGTYTDERHGRLAVAESGDIVYTPIGSEYHVRFSDFADERSHTVGINFLIFDEDGEPLVLSDAVTVFHTARQTLSVLFHRALRNDVIHRHTDSRISLMEILCALASHDPRQTMPDYLASAVRYLAEHIEEDPTVAELAARCNVSEVYFRRQWKAYMGMTPTESRNAMRLSRARVYLEHGEISVQEISETLGYATVAHFIKMFKAKYGCTPLRYRYLSRATPRE